MRKGVDAYREALEAQGIKVSAWADQTRDRVGVAAIEKEIALTRLTSAQLGFAKDVRRDAIYERALAAGLERCVPEVGPRLREEYVDQRIGDWLLIGMDPVSVRSSQSNLFVLERRDDGVLWLNSYWAISGHLWSPESRWVFTLPRAASSDSPRPS